MLSAGKVSLKKIKLNEILCHYQCQVPSLGNITEKEPGIFLSF